MQERDLLRNFKEGVNILEVNHTQNLRNKHLQNKELKIWKAEAELYDE